MYVIFNDIFSNICESRYSAGQTPVYVTLRNPINCVVKQPCVELTPSRIDLRFPRNVSDFFGNLYRSDSNRQTQERRTCFPASYSARELRSTLETKQGLHYSHRLVSTLAYFLYWRRRYGKRTCRSMTDILRVRSNFPHVVGRRHFEN